MPTEPADATPPRKVGLRHGWRQLLVVSVASVLVVALFERTTGLIDVQRFTWDNVRYIRMATTWFAPDALTSPFAYRWGTPLLARLLSEYAHVSLTMGFRIIAWTGAVLQLVSAYYLVRVVCRSVKAEWAGWAAVALSVWNVRFLMFDPFRPDHLAYPVVILASLAAAKRRYGALIALTLVGAPFREFTVIPLLAVIAVLMAGREWRTLAKWAAPFLITLGLAVALPRILIHTTESRQTVDLATFVPDMLRLLGFWQRDINIVLGYASYAVPVLMLFTRPRFAAFWRSLERDFQRYLIAYSIGVFVLVFMGGTDIHRFVTYMVVPFALIVGGLARQATTAELLVTGVAMIWFNRLAEPIPDRVVDEYKDFWGGWSGRINGATMSRFLGVALCTGAGQLTRWLSRPRRVDPNKSSAERRDQPD